MYYLFHHDCCADGFLAYVLLRAGLEAKGVPSQDIHRFPVQYKRPWPIKEQHIGPGDHVFILDFSAPYRNDADIARLDRWHEVTEGHLLILDHHENVPSLLRERPYFHFDPEQSGAGLAWEFVRSDTFLPVMPPVVEFVQWRDLGRTWQQPEHEKSPISLQVHATLMRTVQRRYGAWLNYLHYTASGLAQYCALAAGPLRLRDNYLIQAATLAPSWLEIAGHIVPAVDGIVPELVSDALASLLARFPAAPFAASWSVDPDGCQMRLSLRSRKDGFNVGELATAMGGGGHPCAAGFTTEHHLMLTTPPSYAHP